MWKAQLADGHFEERYRINLNNKCALSQNRISKIMSTFKRQTYHIHTSTEWGEAIRFHSNVFCCSSLLLPFNSGSNTNWTECFLRIQQMKGKKILKCQFIISNEVERWKNSHLKTTRNVLLFQLSLMRGNRFTLFFFLSTQPVKWKWLRVKQRESKREKITAFQSEQTHFSVSFANHDLFYYSIFFLDASDCDLFNQLLCTLNLSSKLRIETSVGW